MKAPAEQRRTIPGIRASDRMKNSVKAKGGQELLAHSSADVNRRIGAEISTRTVKRALDDLIENGKIL